MVGVIRTIQAGVRVAGMLIMARCYSRGGSSLPVRANRKLTFRIRSMKMLLFRTIYR